MPSVAPNDVPVSETPSATHWTHASRPRVAVVGAGISGLTAAHLLSSSHEVTLYEQQDRLGGHAHTHRVDVGTGIDKASVDSGFIVLNDRTYPLLNRLLIELGVAIRPTEMSMSVSCSGCGLGYVGGRGAKGIFAQRRRLVDPMFWKLLTSVVRFQRHARIHLADGARSLETYGEFLVRHGFGTHFVEHYALPIVSCVWSSGQQDTLDYPAAYLFEFLSHHGFLRLRDAPQWYVVEGGARTYVDAIESRLGDIRRATGVTGVTRGEAGVTVTDATGGTRDFDRIVIATHPDEALGLLTDPTPGEKEVLGAFSYVRNSTVLHRDESVLPRRVAERASWNFHLDSCHQRSDAVQVSYWMNRLQHHPEVHPLVVTLNAGGEVAPDKLIAQMDYSHPLFTPASVAAQRRLGEIATGTTTYAGAYHGWGFHEDGCRAGVAAARHFGVNW
ncbi:MAG: FAD-dependent oxidoreductase [Propionibacteriales bacterium]|nr:FAD-dependent oxidoreductase [Propionibacteriales bacterium]